MAKVVERKYYMKMAINNFCNPKTRDTQNNL
jgi:hypothetical protein